MENLIPLGILLFLGIIAFDGSKISFLSRQKKKEMGVQISESDTVKTPTTL